MLPIEGAPLGHERAWRHSGRLRRVASNKSCEGSGLSGGGKRRGSYEIHEIEGREVLLLVVMQRKAHEERGTRRNSSSWRRGDGTGAGERYDACGLVPSRGVHEDVWVRATSSRGRGGLMAVRSAHA